MHDQPTAVELLAAVRAFLQDEVLPAIDDQRLRFRMLVAANVLSIVERELPGAQAQLYEEWASLQVLLGLPIEVQAPGNDTAVRAQVRAANVALCAQIRAGAADEGAWRGQVFAHVRRCVETKLLVSNPQYVARLHAEYDGAP